MRQLIAVALFCAGLFCIAQAQVPMTGAGLGAPSSGGSGCSQATTFIARTSGLSANEQTGYTNGICYWVNNSVYSLIDVAYIFATNNTTTAVLNLVSTSFSANIVTGGTFTADQGILGNGTSTIIDSTFNPSTAGGNYALNTGFLGVYNRTSDTTSTGAADLGAGDGTNNISMFTMFAGPTRYIGSINTTSPFSDILTNANGQGNYVHYRTGASATVIRKNESSLGTGTSSSSALPNANICIFGFGTSNCGGGASDFVAHQIAAVVIGGGITTTAQADAIAHGFNLYMTAVGTNVY